MCYYFFSVKRLEDNMKTIRAYLRTMAMVALTLVTGLTAWGMHVMLPADPFPAWGMTVATVFTALATVALFSQQKKAAIAIK